ncbi:MAG: hypothetical protein EZS28_013026 [Streblomastix strix]|uniref:Uncharacterized protein n=1 Tax=Streblomastix strix TaxID=222440 RepID=A0A5J4W953_9EUKA|nr:MAG: hypothetical protein EZS28_013026 [Streblomastix strix]
MQHSDYISGYMQLGEVIKTLSIHPQSFEISKQNFFDFPLTELTSSGVKYIRAPLGARGKSAYSMVQTCQVIWTITIPANSLAIQLNKTYDGWDTTGKLIQRTNFNGKEDALADWITDMSQAEQGYFGKSALGLESSEHLQFWIRFSTASGPFYQFQLMKDATALWGFAIYAREQAVISGNSLSDLCTKNSVSVSPLESIIEGKRHFGVFIDIPLCEIDGKATADATGTLFYYKIPNDITICEVFDLNQLNSVFNSIPVITHNYAILYLLLWIQDFLQDLKVVWLYKNDTLDTDDSFMRGYNSSKLDSSTNIQVILQGNLTKGIIDTTNISPSQNQNGFKQFIRTRAYPDPTQASITPMIRYMCDAFVRIIFDDSLMLQLLNIDVIGELAGGAIKPQ